MYEQEIFKNLARAKTRDSLRDSTSFLTLGLEEQKNLFRDLYRRNYRDLVTAHSAPAQPVVRAFETAGQMIDDSRHLNQRIDQAGELAGDFINEVDFPQFVKDLLKGVFDANLQVTIQQMEAYQKLLKAASESVAKFVNAIDDTAAFGYLAENQSDDFNLGFSPSEKNEDGSPKTVLTNREGEPADLGDNEVKSRIMDAKIKMAQEQRALLREMLLVGMQRLVVEKGNVKASVVFDIKATERVNKTDQAAIKEAKSNSGSISGSGGLVGSILGGPSGGYTTSTRKTKLSVSTAQSQASTDLTAKVMGSVDITFKSDFFNLNNFAQMYGPTAAAPSSSVAPGTPGVTGAPAAPRAAAPPAAQTPGGGR